MSNDQNSQNRKEKLFEKMTSLAITNRLNTIKEINAPLDIDLYGNKCEETYCYSYKTNLLGHAAFEGNLFLVNALLDAGANPNVTSFGYRQEYTPVHLAIYGTSHEYGTGHSKTVSIDDRVQIIESLHKHGADLDWRGNGGYSWSPLYVASHPVTSASGGSSALINKLLSLGADPKGFFSCIGLSLLTFACEEAAKKYQSDFGYELPKLLHNTTATLLSSFNFQYSPEIQKLQVFNINACSERDESLNRTIAINYTSFLKYNFAIRPSFLYPNFFKPKLPAMWAL